MSAEKTIIHVKLTEINTLPPIVFGGSDTILDIGILVVRKTGKLTIAAGTEVWVKEGITVEEGGTLIIEDGVKFYFEPRGDYKSLNKGAFLGVNKGTIKATGKKKNRIWFTSHRNKPINGDWPGIRWDSSSSDSRLDFVIIEYADLGIEMQYFTGKPNLDIATIDNSIVRWCNSEGIYAEKSSFSVKNCLLYGNGYHEIAIEHENKDVIIDNNVFHSGWTPINVDSSGATITNNGFYNYDFTDVSAVTVSNKKDPITVTVEDNLYWSNQKGTFHSFVGKLGGGGTIKYVVNNNNPINVASIEECQKKLADKGVKDKTGIKLGYLPGTKEDQYPYIYDQCDQTRHWQQYGWKLGMPWGLTWAYGYLWVPAEGISRYDPYSDQVKKVNIPPEFKAIKDLPIQALTVNEKDFSFWIIEDEKENTTIHRIGVIEDFGKKLWMESWHKCTMPAGADRAGIACDGDHLYLQKKDVGNVLLRYDIPIKSFLGIGDIEKTYLTKQFTPTEITLKDDKDGPLNLAGPFCWDGDGFWMVVDKPKSLARIKVTGTFQQFPFPGYWECIGKPVYSMYRVAFNVMGMAWEPWKQGAPGMPSGVLWTAQRACENRPGHIFKIFPWPCLEKWPVASLDAPITTAISKAAAEIVKPGVMDRLEVLQFAARQSSVREQAAVVLTAPGAAGRHEELTSETDRDVKGPSGGQPAVEISNSGASDRLLKLRPGVSGNIARSAERQPAFELQASTNDTDLLVELTPESQRVVDSSQGQPGVELTAPQDTDRHREPPAMGGTLEPSALPADSLRELSPVSSENIVRADETSMEARSVVELSGPGDQTSGSFQDLPEGISQGVEARWDNEDEWG